MFARAIVAARFPIMVGWVAAAVVMALTLPTLREAQTGALGQLVPAGSRALEAEELSATSFRFPLSSRTVVVERDASGLSPERVATTARLINDVNRQRVPGVRAAGAYGVANSIPSLTFAREGGTTALSSLLFGLDFNQNARVASARRYAAALRPPAGSVVGITGAIPARAEQAALIEDGLPLIELVTVALISVIVAVYLRSLLAPLVTLLTVALAYVVSVRFVAGVGERVGLSVPPEVEPIMVALLFGVVTDYGLFYMSRFRRRLLEGEPPRDAARGTAAELTPLIVVCGVSVAAGSAALVIADLGFLRAFGPGMAVAVLVGLVVTITFMPAMLATVGRALLWPGPRHPRQRAAPTGWLDRLIVTAVRAPGRTTIVCLLMLAAMASGLAWLKVGNPLIRGLPSDSEPRVAYEELGKGFAPGALSPTTLVVTGAGIADRRDELSSLQAVLGGQPGVAGVLGPATTPSRQPFGIVVSPSGDAVRFVMIPENDPLSADAVRLLRNLDARIDGLLEVVGLPHTRPLFAGDTAITGELIDTAGSDLFRVVPVVLVALVLILAVFLRALLAPLYLVLLAALAPLAALGLAVVFFQGVLNEPELTYFVPLAAGVLLIALGSDYNIFLVGRIWGEAGRMPLREAIVAAGSGASHAISAAGLVLAASFAALALVPVAAFHQLAFVLSTGLLIDAFLVRSVLTPAVIALVGERSSWPGNRLAAPARTRLPEPAP
ncbi:MAG TPA: MMPL family transporter [Solirubrobacteraceae bacterium]|nr:MMPL family transporter [Solirubrobacteraceae bacterium]